MRILVKFSLASLLVVSVMANPQAWSEQSYLNVPHTLSCNFTNGNDSVTPDHKLTWTKLGRDTELTTDNHYQLQNDSGIINMLLKIRSVTQDMHGFYFCTVRNASNDYVGRVVKGVNIVIPLYDDMFEQYRTDFIRAVISAASVFTFIVGICVIDRLRYKTAEQKQKMRDRKQDRIRKLQQSQNGGVDNLAMQDGEPTSGKRSWSPSSIFDSNTHL